MESNERTVAAAPHRPWMRMRVGALVLALLAGGCATQSASTTDDAAAGPNAASASEPAAQDPSAVVATTFGKGTYSDGEVSTVAFMYDAELNGAGESRGFFRHSGTYGDGRIELSGQVTCVGFDHPEGRAWVAGTIDKNTSTVDFASPDSLPVGSVAGFVVEDSSVALNAHMQFPQPLAGNRSKAARKFCDKRLWPGESLYPLTGGTLGVFP